MSDLNLKLPGEEFKKQVISALSSETAIPMVILIFDQEKGWSMATANHLVDNKVMRKQAASLLFTFISKTRLFDEISRKAD